MPYKQNGFTLDLLNYEMEGDYAISLPDRWAGKPPLYARTPLVEEMEHLAERMFTGEQREWYFLIGAPGNGKSEAVGALRRKFREQFLAKGLPDPFDNITGTGGGSVARRLDVSLPKEQTLTILQDATVPLNETSDPAKDLIDTIQEAEESPTTSLIVCANRGVLAKASGMASGSVKRVLQWVSDNSGEGIAKPPSSLPLEHASSRTRSDVRVWPLDHESVMYGRETSGDNPWKDPSGSALDVLIQDSADASRWEKEGCNDCDASADCPFYLDAQWLRNGHLKAGLLSVLRRAEVLSGHRVVLRESLTLLARILVGSRHDFDGKHPCVWVAERHESLDEGQPEKRSEALLALLSHRIYMDLFGRSAPGGLETNKDGPDFGYLEVLRSQAGLSFLAEAIVTVDKNSSKDVGISRLVGQNGVLSEMDSLRFGLLCPLDGFDPDGRANDQREAVKRALGGALPSLERRMFDLALGLEKASEDLPAYTDPAKLHAAVNRWLSAFSTRLVSIALGQHMFANELGIYLDLLGNPTSSFSYGGRRITLDQILEDFCSPQGKAIYEISKGLRIPVGGLYALPSTNLPRKRSVDPAWPASDGLEIQLCGDSSEPVKLPVPARILVYLLNTQLRGLSRWCLPREIDQAFSRWIKLVAAMTQATRRRFNQAEFDDGQSHMDIIVKGDTVTVR